jgi:hypothetical protein
VLCIAGGAIAGITILSSANDKPSTLASGKPSTSESTTPAESPSTEPSETASGIKVVAPARLLGQPRITEEQLTKLADQMTEQMKKSAPDATNAVSGFYGRPSKQILTMVVAVAAPIDEPSAFVTGLTTGLKTSLSTGSFHEVSPGPLGGTAKCADAKASGVSLAVCIWADKGSFGIVGFYFKKVSAVKDDFVKARSQTEIPA